MAAIIILMAILLVIIFITRNMKKSTSIILSTLSILIITNLLFKTIYITNSTPTTATTTPTTWSTQIPTTLLVTTSISNPTNLCPCLCPYNKIQSTTRGTQAGWNSSTNLAITGISLSIFYRFIVIDSLNCDLFVHYDDLSKAGVPKDKLMNIKNQIEMRF